MKILLTNDDGYTSAGITILEKCLEEAGHEIWVCAPVTQRSATSHSISMHQTVQIQKKSERHYTCSGSPADCVLFALKGAIPFKPDLVVSGINHGYNTSTDILYSGTVGAASEGALHGIPSIAISCHRPFGCKDVGAYPFEYTAKFLARNVEELVKFCDSHSFLSINVPPEPNGSWKWGTVGYVEYYDKLISPEPDFYQIVGSAEPIQKCNTPGTDLNICKSGSISISALCVLPPIDILKTGQHLTLV